MLKKKSSIKMHKIEEYIRLHQIKCNSYTINSNMIIIFTEYRVIVYFGASSHVASLMDLHGSSEEVSHRKGSDPGRSSPWPGGT